MARRRKGFVIDTDVAQACGAETPHDPRPGRCARFLGNLRDICYRMVLTDALRTEWRPHRSSLFHEWRVSMMAQGTAKVAEYRPVMEPGLRTGILRTALDEGDERELSKDLHVVEAALETGSVIASCDEAARERFARAASKVTRLRHILWINPGTWNPAELEAWLKAGARPRKSLTLGHACE